MNQLFLVLSLFLNEAREHNVNMHDSITFKVEHLDRYNAKTVKVKEKWEITIDSTFFLYYANKPQMNVLLYRQLSHIYYYEKGKGDRIVMHSDEVYKRHSIEQLNRMVFNDKKK